MDTVLFYIFYFFFYSAIGWLIESIYCSVAAKKWINRGFMTGPLCPIYGTGVMAMVILVGPLKKIAMPLTLFGYTLNMTPVVVCIAGMLVCDIVEFITSVLMEKLFHARWWDYSNKRFNIQGRICLGHTMYWGVGTLGVLYLVHPFVESIFVNVPVSWIKIALIVIFIVFTLDLINAVRAAMDVQKIMDKSRTLADKIKGYSAGMRTAFEEAKLMTQRATQHLQGVQKRDYHGDHAKKPRIQRLKRGRIGRLFFGYPTLRKDAQSRLRELELVINEIEKRIFTQNNDNNEMY